MVKENVIRVYNNLLSGERKRLVFSKGYPIFEEMYKLYKDDLERNNFIRKEVSHIGWCEVIIEKNVKEEEIENRKE